MSSFDLTDLERCIFHCCFNLADLCFTVQFDLFLARPVKMCCQRLLYAFHGKQGIQRPVFLRDKCIDFFFPVTDEFEGCRLNTPRTQATLNLLPEQRTDQITHHTVQDTPGLLGIYQIHIDLPGSLDRILYCIFRNLIEGDTIHLLWIELQCRGKMP